MLKCVAVCCTGYRVASISSSIHHQAPFALCCSVLQCTAVCCSVLQRVAVCCSVLQCATVCCSALQCVAVRYRVLQCAVCCSALQCVAVRYRVLQCAAAYCSVLKRIAVCYSICPVNHQVSAFFGMSPFWQGQKEYCVGCKNASFWCKNILLLKRALFCRGKDPVLSGSFASCSLEQLTLLLCDTFCVCVCVCVYVCVYVRTSV